MATDMDVQHKKLSELRVIDLRNELEKRNLDKSGNKAALIDRLSMHLMEENENPNEYLFAISGDSPRKSIGKRTPVGKMSTKDKDEGDRDSDDEQDTNDSFIKTRKTGLEAADIVQDALQLDIEDELNEDRDEEVLDLRGNRSYPKAPEDRQGELKENEENTENGEAMPSPPKPETAPVVVPLTVDDMITLDTSIEKKATDDVSMIVNVDDTQSEMMEGDLDMSCLSSLSNNESRNMTSRQSGDGLQSSSSPVKVVHCEGSKEDRNESEDVAKEVQKADDTSKDTTGSSDAPVPSTPVKDSVKENEGKSSKAKSSISRDTKSSKGKKTSSPSSQSRNVWVSGLDSHTRASELQALFKKFGKVIGAKIITNTRIPGSRCYGFITMETAEQSDKCIQNLNNTELHGHSIHVEKNRPDESSCKKNGNKKVKSKESDKTKEGSREKTKKEEDHETKSEDSLSEVEKDEDSDKDEKDDFEKKDIKERKEHRHFSPKNRLGNRPPPPRRLPIRRPAPSFMMMRRNYRGIPMGSRGAPRGNPVMLRRIEAERVIRRRERERDLRETERRRVEMMRHERDLARKHHEERERLEREKEKLRMEKERLEREKAEFIRLEREKARLERERIEREREELRRRQAQMSYRIDEGSSSVGVPGASRQRPMSAAIPKRPYESRDQRDIDPYWDDRKRNTMRIDAPSAPRPPFMESSVRDFDARSHGPPYDTRDTGNYKRKMDMGGGGNGPREYDRRDSMRHGHDRDDRRVGNQGYYRDSRGPPQREYRDRRGGRDNDWKIHDNRRDRFGDKGGISSGMSGYNNRSFAGGDRGDNWSSGERSSLQSSIGKLPYATSSMNESRSRGSNMSSSLMSGSNVNIPGIFSNNSNVPMGGIVGHNMGSSPINSSDSRSYMGHSVRRF